MIIPVIHTKDLEEKSSARHIVIVCRYRDYQLGIELWGAPYILSVENCREIQRPEAGPLMDIWIEKAILQAEEELYTVVDLEKTILNLARYFQEDYLRV